MKTDKSFSCLKKFLSFTVMLSILLPFLFTAVNADETKNTPKAFRYYDSKSFFDFAEIEIPETDAGNIFVANITTGDVMFEKDAQMLIFPASTVKIMTAIVAYENIPDLDVLIYASEKAIKKTTGTKLNPTRPIKADEGLSARDLLYGLLVTGANDAANVLAEYVGGTEENFVEMMNAKAKEIGAKNTTFKNPTGLHHPDMTTTAYDMALISNYAYYINDIVKMAGSTNHTIEETNITKHRRSLYNRNRMIRRVEGEANYFYKGALGLSAGSTPEGGNCVIAIAEKSGQTYLAVVMNADSTPTENFAYSDAKTLLNTCFDNFSVQKVAKSGDIHHEIPVSLAANVDHIILHAAKDISALLPNNVDKEKDILLKKLVYSDAVAPISANQIFGELEVVYKGTITLGKTELAAGNSVDRSNLLYFLDALRRFFTSPWFITAFITAIILFTIYCFLYYKALKNKRGYRRYK